MSEPTTRLFLARHCDVHNPDGVLYGHLPDFPLSEKGVRQAHALGRHFAALGVRRIHASPLLRAQQTAEIIASHLDDPVIVSDDDLVEAKFGIYLQGTKPKHVPWRKPLWLVHMVWPGLLPHDESVTAMSARVERALARLLEAGDGAGVCVSHGDPIQAFWIRRLGRPVWALHRLACAKGGFLEIPIEGARITGPPRYHPPTEVGAEPSPSPAGEASHA